MSLSLFVLYLIYFFFLKNETNFKLNRFYLLLSLVFSVVFPFLEFETVVVETPVIFEKTFQKFETFGKFETEKILVENTSFFKEIDYLFWSYILVSVLFFSFLIKEIYTIQKIISSNKSYFFKKIRFVLLPEKCNSFSFFNNLFLSEKIENLEEKRKIVLHEKIHIKQFHSLDILFLELLKIVFWCNPLIYIYKKALRDVHEYLADDGVLEKENNTVDYKRLLLREFFYSNYKIANSFTQLTLKNRLIMMTKLKSPKISKFKILFALPVLFSLIVFFACTKDDNFSQDEETFDILKVEVEPHFPNGLDGFFDYMENSTKRFEKERKEGLHSEISLSFSAKTSFVVTKNGIIKDINILSITYFDKNDKKLFTNYSIKNNQDIAVQKHVTQILKDMPQLEAGEKNGKYVNVKVVLSFANKIPKRKELIESDDDFPITTFTNHTEHDLIITAKLTNGKKTMFPPFPEDEFIEDKELPLSVFFNNTDKDLLITAKLENGKASAFPIFLNSDYKSILSPYTSNANYAWILTTKHKQLSFATSTIVSVEAKFLDGKLAPEGSVTFGSNLTVAEVKEIVANCKRNYNEKRK